MYSLTGHDGFVIIDRLRESRTRSRQLLFQMGLRIGLFESVPISRLPALMTNHSQSWLNDPGSLQSVGTGHDPRKESRYPTLDFASVPAGYSWGSTSSQGRDNICGLAFQRLSLECIDFADCHACSLPLENVGGKWPTLVVLSSTIPVVLFLVVAHESVRLPCPSLRFLATSTVQDRSRGRV